MTSLRKFLSIIAVGVVGLSALAPRSSRGDVDPFYKCATHDPTRPLHVFGSDNRIYCCSVADPTPKPPQDSGVCMRAPFENYGSGTACASAVDGIVYDTETQDIFGDDESPLEFFLVPSQTCDVCAGTTAADLLALARQKAAQFCAKDAKFQGTATLLTFEPLGGSARVCDKWRFTCSCPGAGTGGTTAATSSAQSAAQ